MFKAARIVLAAAGATLLHASLVLIEPSGTDAQFMAEFIMQIVLMVIGIMVLLTAIIWRPEQ